MVVLPEIKSVSRMDGWSMFKETKKSSDIEKSYSSLTKIQESKNVFTLNTIESLPNLRN